MAEPQPQEPPSVSTWIPYIGHAIGLMQSKFNYYAQLSQKHDLPIFMVTVPGMKMYIVTKPYLIQAIQKQPKVLAFPPIEAKFSNQICGPSKEAHEIVMKNVNGDEGDWGLSMESYATMKSALAPGVNLDGMNRVMMKDVAQSVEELLPSSESKTVRISLNKWLRDKVTRATTNSVYGPQNPYKDQALQDAFWDFESDLVTILLGVFPSFTARKGLAGRAKVVEAFEKYFHSKGHEQGSILVRNRYDTITRNGVSIEDTARYEVGGSLAVLVNTAPAAFWALFYIYSHSDLLEEIREEIRKQAAETIHLDGVPVGKLDITSLKANCPLLTSAFQEVLRVCSVGTSVRQVMEDTVLDGTWLLKKDAMIQMPTRVIHTDASIWGADVDQFDPRRFMKDAKPKTDNGKRPGAAAFRAFGGGSTLCPGRHFATNEILAVVAMMVLQYDLRPTTGEWVKPTCEKTNMASVVMEPDVDIEVEVSRCQGWGQEQRWIFALKDSDQVFALTAEDRGEVNNPEN